jgi:hypothetical protein
MTKGDFILNILCSMIGGILLNLAYKYYPDLLKVVTKVIALRFALIRVILSNYYLFKNYSIELKNHCIELSKATYQAISKVTSQAIKATKNNLVRVMSLPRLENLDYSKSFTGVSQATLRSPYTMGVVLAIFMMGLLALTFIWGRLHSWPNEQRQELTRELYQLNTTSSYLARDRGRRLLISDNIIEIKTSPDIEGKSALIRVPRGFSQEDYPSLNFKVDTSNGRCMASARTKSGKVIAITPCSIITGAGNSL